MDNSQAKYIDIDGINTCHNLPSCEDDDEGEGRGEG